MIGGVQEKILVTESENGTLVLDEMFSKLLGLTEEDLNWKLLRVGDGLIKRSQNIGWLEWADDGYFKERHSNIALNRSLLMSPFSNEFFTWQTTPVNEIIKHEDDYIEFKTQNSHYKLSKIKK